MLGFGNQKIKKKSNNFWLWFKLMLIHRIDTRTIILFYFGA